MSVQVHIPSSRFFFSLLIRRLPRSPLFPYTTLFRSFTEIEQQRQRGRDRHVRQQGQEDVLQRARGLGDRKSTRLNSSHVKISYAVFCLKKKTKVDSDAIVLSHSILPVLDALIYITSC